MSSDEMRRTAAKILAAALCEHFPECELLYEEATSLYFYCECKFSFPFQKEMIPFIEERMKAIVKEKREIRTFEMMPSNAAAFFFHHGREDLAERARELDYPLVSVIQMGEFVDFCQGDFLKSTGEVKAFKILEAIETKDGNIRIFGVVSENKAELKAAVKENKNRFLKDHVQIGEEQKLFLLNRGSWTFLPKGETLRQNLLQFLRNELAKENFQFVSSCNEEVVLVSHYKIYSSLHSPSRIAECKCIYEDSPEINKGLLAPFSCFKDFQHIFCKRDKLLEECISSLQFISKISKIFNFEHKVFLCSSYAACERAGPGWKKNSEMLKDALHHCKMDYILDEESVSSPRIEIRIQDAVGREWEGPSLSIDCSLRHDIALLVRSAFYSLERWIALLLERSEGVPFWLAPEQVRIFAVDETEVAALQESWHSLGLRVGLDCRKQNLGTRLTEALSEKVPYLVVLGNKERGSGKIAVRALSWKKEETMSVEAFTQKLIAEINHGIEKP